MVVQTPSFGDTKHWIVPAGTKSNASPLGAFVKNFFWRDQDQGVMQPSVPLILRAHLST
jgi:hypothetical protein